MNLVKVNAENVVTHVNCGDADIEAPADVDCGWKRTSTNPDVWVDLNAEPKRQAAIEAKADAIIDGRFPLKKKLEMQARYSELNGRLIVLPFTAESAEKARLEAAWDWIRSVRLEEKRLKDDPALTVDDGEWPDPPA